VAARLFKRAKSDTIVLTGLSGSGKTVLFYQVSTGIVGFVYSNVLLVKNSII
jgi:adenylylsulfate kinase-like enzyme